MSNYRISKFDPRSRDETGAFRRDDWTSVSDIGGQFGANRLSFDGYMAVENAYVDIASQLASLARMTRLRVTALETGDGAGVDELPFAAEISAQISTLADGVWVKAERLGLIVRANLRELVWCKLEGPNGFYLHFGYDYYMYVGGEGVTRQTACPEGIFLEEFESPYQDETSQ